jgi:hypothetical protein
MAVRVDKDNDSVEESGGERRQWLMSTWCGDGILESPSIRFMCLRRRLRQLQHTKA